MATPFATRGSGDFIVRDGDSVSGDSATSGAGGNLTVEGGDAAATTNTDGGDVILRPGLEDGTGSIGEVSVTNRTGTEDDPIIAFSSATGNSHTIRWRTGTVQPNSDLVPASGGGDLYVQSDGTIWIASASGTGNWTQLSTGGAGSTDAGQTGVQYEGLLFYADAGNRTSYGGSGTTWTDLIAQTAGTMTSVTVTDGYLNFDGAASIVNFGVLSGANENIFDGGGSVCAWVRAETDGEGTVGRIITTEGASAGGWFLGSSGGATATYDITFEQRFTTSNGRWSFTASVVPFSEWVHVAVVYDADSAANDPTIYVNGVVQTIEENNVPSGTRESDSGETLYVGNESGQTATFDGDINGVYLYGQALTKAEVLRHYNATNKYLRPDIIGHQSTVNSGESLVIRGGDTTSTAASAEGGDVTIQGGSTGSTNVSGTAHGGDIFILGGATDTGGSGIADGGDITVRAGTPDSNNGDGGEILIEAGDGATGGGNADGGSVTINAGDGQISAQGGGIALTGGLSLGAVVTGGPIDITGGQNDTSSGTGGLVTITGGQGERSGGDITIKGGTKNASGANFSSGDILIESGDIAGTSGYDFGSITIQVPDPVTPSTDNILGGDITIKAGTTGIRNADGGDVSITAGDTFGFNTRLGGSISLTAGDENNGTSSSEGGSILMAPGTSVSGTDGRVKVQGTATLEFTERASALGIAAGVGYFWVRSDTPNVPMFTDDAGTDFVLNSGGGTPTWAAVLAVGATSGGTNPILTNADVFQGADATGANAGVMAIRGGDVTSGAGDGGTVNIDGGDAGAGGGSGGPINVTGGASVGSENNGGEVIVTGGGATDGGGGGVTAQGGPGTGTGRSGGNLILRGGTPGTNANGGQVQISGRLGNGTGSGGLVSIAAGQGGVTGAGANVTMGGGDGGATSGNGGAVIIDGGAVTSGTEGAISIGSVSAGAMLIGINGGGTRIATSLGMGATGSASITADGSITFSPGGSLVLDYSTWPAAEGTSGQVLSTNGAGVLSWATGGASTWAATLAVGATSGGTAPEISVGDPFLMNENTTVPGGTPAAGKGTWWVRDDAPNTPMFTADDGTDYALNLGSQWQQATVQTTDASPTTAATAQTLLDGEQTFVEVEIRAEVNGTSANTYLHRQVISYYRDGGGAVQWAVSVNDAEQRRGTLTTATATLTTSGNDIIVQVTGQASTTIDWTVQYRTSATVADGVGAGGGGGGSGTVTTVDKRGASKTVTASASSGGGTATGSLSLGINSGLTVYLKVTANGNTTNSDIEFWRDAGKTDQVYQALGKDAFTSAFADGTPWSFVTASDLTGGLLYYTITNNGSNASTYDIEALFHGE